MKVHHKLPLEVGIRVVFYPFGSKHLVPLVLERICPLPQHDAHGVTLDGLVAARQADAGDLEEVRLRRDRVIPGALHPRSLKTNFQRRLGPDVVLSPHRLMHAGLADPDPLAIPRVQLFHDEGDLLICSLIIRFMEGKGAQICFVFLLSCLVLRYAAQVERRESCRHAEIILS
eukprot:451460-Hanusia_phi.AAC.11